MHIAANRLDRGFYKYQEEFEQKALAVLRSGRYVLGEEVSNFEKECMISLAGALSTSSFHTFPSFTIFFPVTYWIILE